MCLEIRKWTLCTQIVKCARLCKMCRIGPRIIYRTERRQKALHYCFTCKVFNIAQVVLTAIKSVCNEQEQRLPIGRVVYFCTGLGKGTDCVSIHKVCSTVWRARRLYVDNILHSQFLESCITFLRESYGARPSQPCLLNMWCDIVYYCFIRL